MSLKYKALLKQTGNNPIAPIVGKNTIGVIPVSEKVSDGQFRLIFEGVETSLNKVHVKLQSFEFENQAAYGYSVDTSGGNLTIGLISYDASSNGGVTPFSPINDGFNETKPVPISIVIYP